MWVGIDAPSIPCQASACDDIAFFADGTPYNSTKVGVNLVMNLLPEPSAALMYASYDVFNDHMWNASFYCQYVC